MPQQMKVFLYFCSFSFTSCHRLFNGKASGAGTPHGCCFKLMLYLLACLCGLALPKLQVVAMTKDVLSSLTVLGDGPED